MHTISRFVYLSLFLCLATFGLAQAPAASLMPVPRMQFLDVNGKPLAGGFVYSYIAGTSIPQATFTDSSGTIQNTNPIQLDSGGFAAIWIGPQKYRIVVTDANLAQQWVVDNVSNDGQLLFNLAVLLSPVNGALQTISGPLAATYFVQTTPHVTSPGVRVSILDPLTVLDTLTNPPNLLTTAPALVNQNYSIPDPLHDATFVMSPNPGGVNGAGNTLDCTQNGLTCKRTAYAWFDGGSCNNTTAALGWDTFGNNSPSPFCATGTNVQKGVMAFPAAATVIQTATCSGAAATTCVASYIAGTTAGHLLEIECAVDGGKTVSGVTDGTNAYTKAINVTNGNTDLEIWYFNGNSTAMAAATSLTVTLSAGANSVCVWREYAGILTTGMLDKTASNTATGTAVTSGTTAGTLQNVELVLAAVGVPAAPIAITAQNGWSPHFVQGNGSSLSVASEGLIQQVVTTQSGGFTLGSSQAWASAIATFKVSVAGAVSAQRELALPSYYLASAPVNAAIKWQGVNPVVGAVDVALGAQVVCTVDGNSDDGTFNTAVTATPAVNPSAANLLTTTSLNALTATGCAAGSQMHLQIERLRYNVLDTYENWVYVTGASLQFGITQ